MSIEESPIVSMANATKIIRKSIYTFLQNYHYLTSIATFIALPFSISFLLSQALAPHSIIRLDTVFNAAGFTRPPVFFSIVSLKLSQTVSTWLLTLPFAISFFLVAKISILHIFNNITKTTGFFKVYNALLTTQICNSLLIFAANATCFSIFFLVLNLLEEFQLNSTKWVFFLTGVFAVFYSIVLANAIVICNFALISSGLETHKSPGFMAILRAALTIKGKTSTALALAVPMNIGLAALEALFHYRIIKAHEHVTETDTHLWLVALEGVLIAYLYSILLVLEVLMSCFFYQSCMMDYIRHDYDHDYESDELEFEFDELCYYNNVNIAKLKGLEDFV